jgi:hypothetical protein
MFRILLASLVPAFAPLHALDLSQAVVSGDPAGIATQVLVEEVARRTLIEWPVVSAPPKARPVIILKQGSGPADGFSIRYEAPFLTLTGNDARGLLFAVGHLLRHSNMSRGRVDAMETALNVVTAPRVKLRGHQLGYRPKTNSYDAWDEAMWDRYIRELALFGTNAIELIPPRSDDAADSPHFPRPPMDMMIRMSRICRKYGLDVWIWYPALDKDYRDAATVEFALKEWGEVFRLLPKIDHVFVPGGDPGHTQPGVLFALLEKQTANLHRYHPKAGMWMAPQGFSAEWFEEFVGLMKAAPPWLTGIVHGPQVRVPIEELRRLIPRRYPIRSYPDITHVTHAQFVIRDMPLMHALTSAREPVNPRPRDMRAILRHQLAGMDAGFLTYSEGCTDDVNKMIWSFLGWDPDARVEDALEQYARLFMDPVLSKAIAEGVMQLEANWKGAGGEAPTLRHFQSIEAQAPPSLLRNWRYLMASYRAHFDAYVAERYRREQSTGRPSPGDSRRVYQLAEALYQTAGMQTSVSLYRAIGRDRGATLDGLDFPLAPKPDQKEWEDPGPGGYYDDLGDPARQPHLVREESYEQDPGHFRTPFSGFPRSYWNYPDWRLSWHTVADIMYDAPIRLRYTGLDRRAQYKVRVVYGGEDNAGRVQRLVADKIHELQPYTKLRGRLTERFEFPVPAAATSDGILELEWTRQPGLPGSGRGNQVAEVWLIRSQVN